MSDQNDDVRLSIWIDPTLRDHVRERAARSNQSVSLWASEALRRAVAQSSIDAIDDALSAAPNGQCRSRLAEPM
jgi:predicted transcriptional regulator